MSDKTKSSAECHSIESTENAGAFFQGAKHLSVTGGTFTSHVNVHGSEAAVHGAWRRILRSDIDIRGGEIDLVRNWRSSPRNHVRRMYPSKIRADERHLSIFIYEGDGAEEEWRQYLSRHAKIWHPNILQIFVVSDSCGIYAVVANDDLLPFDAYISLRHPSPMMMIHLFACWAVDYEVISWHPAILRFTGDTQEAKQYCPATVPDRSSPEWLGTGLFRGQISRRYQPCGPDAPRVDSV
ncbi:hypothetical protein FB45DRAFT_363297 [Roridomyces roridus]|uniref:Uncharacterized protein n=1 Tax=Roridomyces roridus TaxID=1738132 RepID=A0AAD7FTB4_9AGAR|nr:hypothetical protein FB45DRAFT_363297 [Roridomyces roridus]